MHIYSLFFMTSSDGFGFELESQNDEMDRDMHALMMHFGTLEGSTLRIEPGQEMTPEKRAALNGFSTKHSATSPNLNRLAQKIREISDGEFFVLLPGEPATTEFKLRAEIYVQALNNSASLEEAKALFEAEWHECKTNFGPLLQHYDMRPIRTDRRVWFGETDSRPASSNITGAHQNGKMRPSSSFGSVRRKSSIRCCACSILSAEMRKSSWAVLVTLVLSLRSALTWRLRCLKYARSFFLRFGLFQLLDDSPDRPLVIRPRIPERVVHPFWVVDPRLNPPLVAVEYGEVPDRDVRIEFADISEVGGPALSGIAHTQ